MKSFSRPLPFLTWWILLTPVVGTARDFVEVALSPAVREYCHIVRFPLGWQMPRFIPREGGFFESVPKYQYDGDYEFRVAGLLGSKFLVRGVERLQKRYYTTNLYEVDLSDPRAVAQPGREEEWNSGTVITVPRDVYSTDLKFPSRSSNYFEFLGHRFTRIGDEWGGTSLSPDRAVLVVQSWSGTLASGGSDVPLNISPGFGGRNHGKLFFDVYRVDSGKKLVTIRASFATISPEEAFEKTGWLTERYFFVPLDDMRVRCLVCELGRTRQ